MAEREHPAELASHCPASKAAELLGDKWTLQILRAMIMGGTRYSDFTTAIPRISPSVLSARLKRLEADGLVTRKGAGGTAASYHLTPSGRECRPLVFFLARWGLKWAQRTMRVDQIDVGGAMWDLHRTLNLSELPDGETVFSITLTDLDAHNRWWIIAKANDVDLCDHDPGRDVDLYLHAPLATLLQIWMGEMTIDAAMREDRATLTGDAALVRTAPLWFPLSPVAAHETAPA